MLLLLLACQTPEPPPPAQEQALLPESVSPIQRDMHTIDTRGVLRVALPYNSTSYFIHRGAALGFEFELLERFARERELEVEVEVVASEQDRLDALRDGWVDIVGGRLTTEKADGVLWSTVLHEAAPSLVQSSGMDPVDDAIGECWSGVGVSVSARLVERPEELVGREVWARDGSAWETSLLELEDEAGDIHVVSVEPDITNEQLISWVSQRNITFAVAPESLAELRASYHDNIVVHPLLGEPVSFAFAISPEAPELRQALDDWIEENPVVLQALHQRYYIDRQGYRERQDDGWLTGETGLLSEFDALFWREAERIGWDWRLLAAQAYQESRFYPDARSWAGAMGLMQIMPLTARDLGVLDPWDPEQSVRGAADYLLWLDELWLEEITDPEERLKFVLASYNAGFGHVSDARRLAEARGDDPDQWEDVSYWLLQKSRREVYTDPVVRYGFCRGLEPVLYVRHILSRYRHYQQLAPDIPELTNDAEDTGVQAGAVSRSSSP